MAKFTFVKEVEEEVAVYDKKSAKTGDVLEYEGFFADKCRKNPDFEEVLEGSSANDGD